MSSLMNLQRQHFAYYRSKRVYFQEATDLLSQCRIWTSRIAHRQWAEGVLR